MEKLLEIKNLSVDLMSVRGIVYALDGVCLDIMPGEIHGLVGESGCGKSMTSKSIMRLHNPARSRVRGEILFEGRDLLKLSKKEMNKIRGRDISMIFQDPMTSLNPLLTIGQQIEESYRTHEKCSKAQARKETLDILEKVGIYPAQKRIDQYPHELSGGLQQRVMIAMAIACRPKLLIADEPTTALDVTIQAQILELLKKLSQDMNMAILLITHNFGIVAEVCQRVSVMYAGRVVETADTKTIFKHAVHPYSQALIDSIPRAGMDEEYLPTIPGSPPQLFARNEGCPFRNRCKKRFDACEKTPKTYVCSDAPGHTAACHLLEKDAAALNQDASLDQGNEPGPEVIKK
ncbi:MAG TPA: ABC transporter ATP-binding protein [Candidatus Scybalocola faecavium]|nr:ABC transporter ATP-binding protein [Candidatus Scybalocola faecavium]